MNTYFVAFEDRDEVPGNFNKQYWVIQESGDLKSAVECAAQVLGLDFATIRAARVGHVSHLQTLKVVTRVKFELEATE